MQKVFDVENKEEYEDMIGCIGYFYDGWDFDKKRKIGILKAVKDGIFKNQNGTPYMYFIPAKKSELKFYEDK